MAYNNNNQGELSSFNEGAGQMFRLDELQRRISGWFMNLWFFFEHINKFGYELAFTDTVNLYNEGDSKFSEKEREKLDELEEELREIIKTKPIISKTKKNVTIYHGNRNIIEKKLINFLREVRRALEAHNMTSPKSSDPSKAAYK